MEVFTGGPKARTLEFGENEWLGSPIIETSHPDLKWVERSAFVSELRWFVDGDGSVAVENAVYNMLSRRFRSRGSLTGILRRHLTEIPTLSTLIPCSETYFREDLRCVAKPYNHG